MPQNTNIPTPTTTCLDDFDPNALPLSVAREYILEQVSALTRTEHCTVASALGRVLAMPLIAPMDVPPQDNSAMDGYAIRYADLEGKNATEMQCQVIGESFAGAPFSGATSTSELPPAVRIMTGAVIPTGFDTIVMQEHVSRAGDIISITTNQPLTHGQNVRKKGKDIGQNDTLLPAGLYLTAADIGLIASLGITEISVLERPVIAFFSTGDELQQAGTPLANGEIYDSNRHTIRSMLLRMGFEDRNLYDLGIVRDDPNALTATFAQAATKADAIISSGGVSVGDADHVKKIIECAGAVKFWKVAIKPGRPLAFGHVHDKPFFGLPGNPVSTMVTFMQLVRPALEKLRGDTPKPPLRIRARVSEKLYKRAGRIEFQRGTLENDSETGELIVHGTGDQSSNLLTTMSRANCFIILEHDTTLVEAGEMVEVQPFAEYI